MGLKLPHKGQPYFHEISEFLRVPALSQTKKKKVFFRSVQKWTKVCSCLLKKLHNILTNCSWKNSKKCHILWVYLLSFFSRELKRLMSVTLSPVYSHFSETLTGLGTIRALRATVQFSEENEGRLEINQRANYCGKTKGMPLCFTCIVCEWGRVCCQASAYPCKIVWAVYNRKLMQSYHCAHAQGVYG